MRKWVNGDTFETIDELPLFRSGSVRSVRMTRQFPLSESLAALEATTFLWKALSAWRARQSWCCPSSKPARLRWELACSHLHFCLSDCKTTVTEILLMLAALHHHRHHNYNHHQQHFWVSSLTQLLGNRHQHQQQCPPGSPWCLETEAGRGGLN